jgi:hypothetical protein
MKIHLVRLLPWGTGTGTWQVTKLFKVNFLLSWGKKIPITLKRSGTLKHHHHLQIPTFKYPLL